MKKFVNNHTLPLLAVAIGAAGGIAALCLRLWHLTTVDDRGLLASYHCAGILAGILMLLIPGVLLWLSCILPKESTAKAPASVVTLVGYAFGALAMAYAPFRLMAGQADTLQQLAGILGLGAAVALILLAVSHRKGQAGSMICHGIICLFWMLLLLCQYRLWSAETQLYVFGCPLLATVCLMLSSYHKACFDVDAGNPRLYTFFRTASVFFCLASVSDSTFGLLYLAAAIWSAADYLKLGADEKEGG